jgi:hypothetical protein
VQIKAADDKRPQVDALTSLLSRPDVLPPTRKRIEQEIRNIRAGEKGERDAAYDIEFHYGDTKNVVTVHDLRVECDGRVAQIDHLLINRLLEICICESKSFSEGVAINEHGEWSAFYAGRAYGIASPIEQNNRHKKVLSDVFNKGLVRLPKRLGITMKPSIKTVVLVANTARIGRPKTKASNRVEGIDDVIKAERLFATLDKAWDQKNVADFMTLVGQETIANLARDLVALHVPAGVDWPARFGLPAEAPAILIPEARPHPVRVEHRIATAADGAGGSPTSRGVCESCGEAVSAAEAAYCRTNAKRFGGRTLCFACQRRVRRTS